MKYVAEVERWTQEFVTITIEANTLKQAKQLAEEMVRDEEHWQTGVEVGISTEYTVYAVNVEE